MTNSQILDAINQNIKRNENKEITGVILNSVLRMLLDFVNQGFITFSDIIQLLADSKAINVVGSINTTTNTTSLPSGVYHTQKSGTYTNASNIVVKKGYYTLLRKKDDGSWVLESEVKMPSVEIDGNIVVGQTTKAVNGDTVAKYIGNTAFSNFNLSISNNDGYSDDAVVYYNDKLYKSVYEGNQSLPTDTTKWKEIKLGSEVDQEFDSTSNNPLSNKRTTRLAEILESYIDEKSDESSPVKIFKDANAIKGALRKDGTIDGEGSTIYNKFIKIDTTNFTTINVHARPFQSSNSNTYCAILGKKNNNNTLVSLKEVSPSGVTDYYDLSLNVIDLKEVIVCYNYNALDNSEMFIKCFSSEITYEKDSIKKTFDKIIKPLDFFVNPKELKDVVNLDFSTSVAGTLQNNNTNASTSSTRSKILFDVKTNGEKYLNINFQRAGENGSNVNLYPSILGKKTDNTFVILLPTSFLSENEPKKEFNLEIPNVVASISICYATTSSIEAYLHNGDVDVDTVFNSVKDYIDAKTGDNYNPYQEANLRYFDRPQSIARLEVVGALPTNTGKSSVPVDVKLYCNNTLLLKSPADMVLQGSSSLHLYDKKNFTLDLLTEDRENPIDVKIGQWEAFDSFHLKAYATDLTMARDVGGARLWHKIRTNRPYPSNLISLPNVTGTNDTDKVNSYDGALFYTDGFPFEMWVNGVYHGLFVWRIKKDAKNYRIDNKKKTNIFLANSNIEDLKWNIFDHTQWELRSPKLSGYTENGAIPDADVLSKIQRLWNWFEKVRKGEVDFESTASQYINLDSFVDYIISMQMIHHWDHWNNNMMLVSWDSDVFSLVPYDMDFSIGRLSPYWSFTANPAQLVWRGTFWSGVMYVKLRSRINARWTELRNNGFINPKMLDDCYKPFFTTIGRNLYQTEQEKWQFVEENTGKDNYNYFLKFMSEKIAYLDTIWKV